MCREDDFKIIGRKELVAGIIIVLFAALAIWGVLSHKDKIDGVKLVAKEELNVTWLGPIAYYSPISSDNMTISSWGGRIVGTQVIDVTWEVGLRGDGVIVFRRLPRKAGEVE